MRNVPSRCEPVSGGSGAREAAAASPGAQLSRGSLPRRRPRGIPGSLRARPGVEAGEGRERSTSFFPPVVSYQDLPPFYLHRGRVLPSFSGLALRPIWRAKQHWNLPSSCLSLQGSSVTVVTVGDPDWNSRPTCFHLSEYLGHRNVSPGAVYSGLGMDPRVCACWANLLPTDLHGQSSRESAGSLRLWPTVLKTMACEMLALISPQ